MAALRMRGDPRHPGGRGARPRVTRLQAASGAAGWLLVGSMLGSCAHAPAARPAPEVGWASYQGREREGKRTASGRPYRAGELSCAHRTHPFGAVLEVVDLDTGRSVQVRVIDRGPFVSGRIVDLSLAAARELGMVERGVAKVRLTRLE